MNFSIFICCLTIVYIGSDGSLPKRTKRVLNGEIIDGRTTGYDAVRYLATIGTLHGESWYTPWEFVKDGRHICGGALITPEIVQTACHCISHKMDTPNSGIIRPGVNDAWEGIYYIYVGVNSRYGPTALSMSQAKGYKSRLFVLHEKCGKLSVGLISYDYGWVIMESVFTHPIRNLNWVDFAPIYSSAELEKIWNYVTTSRLICLHLGFGPYEEEGSTSNDLRHGWGVVLSYDWCVANTRSGLTNQNVTELVTWVCAMEFYKHKQPIQQGDSGGPFTCNNYYFGVVSAFSSCTANCYKNEAPSYHDALKFVVFQNALEHRTDFRLDMDLLVQTTRPPPPFFGR